MSSSLTLPRRPRQLIPLALLALFLLFLSLPSPSSPPAPRAIISLASTSLRLSHELPPTLWSLLRQSSPPLQIRLHLPKEEEVEIKGRMERGELSEVFGHDKVRLVWAEDEGPATKFLGTVRDLLERAGQDERLLEQEVVVVDDDHVYSPELVQTLLDAHERRPGAAVGMRGWRVREDLRWGVEWKQYWRHVVQGWQLKEDYRVGVLTANEGYLIVPRFFVQAEHIPPATLPPDSSYASFSPLFNYSTAPFSAHLVDDIWISGQLASLLIPRYVVPLPAPRPPSIDITLPHSHTLDAHMSTHSISRAQANDETITFFRGVWEKDLWFEMDDSIAKRVDGIRWVGVVGEARSRVARWSLWTRAKSVWGGGVRWNWG